MNKISINNLTIKYQDFIVLQQFNANLNKGLHWIQGINGSGKSSLLKSLCGLVSMATGTINIAGYDLRTETQRAKSKLCYVPDKPEVYPFMTGMQFLQLLAKIKNTALTQELHDFMQAIHLDQFNDIPFSEMSFGTRRKFTLCSIFIGNPDIVLLDEPFNGLDKNTNKHFTDWLTHAKKEKCILMVSHDNHIVQELSDSTIHLDQN